jgi:hypothetical protein
MDYQINGIPGFESRKVVVRSAGMFSGPKLLVDDEVLKGSWGKYTLRRNDGKQAMTRMINNIIDPVPQLVVDGKIYAPIPPLPWYQLGWAGWPIIMVFVAGLIGALLGALAAYVNTRIFRSNMHMILKYVVTGVISCTAVLMYLILALIIRMAVNGSN